MAVVLPDDVALEHAFDYYDAVTKEDITKVDGVKRASDRVQRLMRAYARHQGTQAPITTLRDDLKANDNNTLDTTRMKAPAFKMILTATGNYAYRRPDDGIYIVPVGCLRD